MALGSENMVYQYCPTSKYQQHKQQLAQYTPPREILRTRNVNQRNIAPAPYTKPTTHLYNTSDGTTLDADNPSVVRRNARERNRVKQVNNGFSNLRQHIPTAIVAEISNGRRGIGPGADKKLSKVDTLRMAAEYIRRLKKLIDEVDSSDASSVSSCGTLNYSSSCATSSTSGSPPPPPMPSQRQQVLSNSDNTHTLFFQQPTQFFNSQQHQPLSYAGSFQQHNLISPANSTSSATYATDLFAHHHQESSPQHYQSSSFEYNQDTPATTPIKFEPVTFDEYHTNNSSSSSADDEELLDYISLWQDERID